MKEARPALYRGLPFLDPVREGIHSEVPACCCLPSSGRASSRADWLWTSAFVVIPLVRVLSLDLTHAFLFCGDANRQVQLYLRTFNSAPIEMNDATDKASALKESQSSWRDEAEGIRGRRAHSCMSKTQKQNSLNILLLFIVIIFHYLVIPLIYWFISWWTTFLAIMNDAAMNIHVHVFCGRVFIYPGYLCRKGKLLV